MNIHLFIVLVLLLASCTSRVERITDPGDSVSGQEPVLTFGTLTLIRVEPEPAPTEVLIHIRGELAAVLGNESFVTLVLPEGTNTLTLDWEDSPLKFEEVVVMEPEVRPGQYLSLIRKFDVPEITRTTNATDFTMVESIAFVELSSTIGKSVIENLDPDFSFVDEQYLKVPN